MKEFHGHARVHIDAAPDAVFELITNVERLPEWNRAIESVLDRPGCLTAGAEWTVRMHPPHAPSWGSVSRVERIDAATREFAYETRNTDGNPSFARWTWRIAPEDDGAAVDVAWDCYLKTADRRLLAGPLRKRGLAREVPTSLAALAAAARTMV